MNLKTSLFLAVIGIHVHQLNFQTLSDVTKLYNNITVEYQKAVIPSWDQSKALDLNFTFVPLVFNSFLETEETISLTVAASFFWKDLRLSWDPSIYGNKTWLTIKTDDIWVPHVYLENSVDEIKPLGHESDFYAIITSDGTVTWSPGGILNAKCPTDIFRFPFDSQTCQFIFTLWSTHKNDVLTHPLTNKAILSYFITDSNWKVTDQRQYVREKDELWEFILEMSIKREPLYNVVVIILPTLLFSFLNPLVFILPVDSGERISLSMTILLSYAIFLVMVTDALPVSSNPMCLLLLIMMIVMLLSGVIVVCAIITVCYYYKEDTSHVSSCLTLLATLCAPKKSVYIKDDASDSNVVISGKDISKRLDTIFLILSYILLIGALLVYFIYVLAT